MYRTLYQRAQSPIRTALSLSQRATSPVRTPSVRIPSVNAKRQLHNTTHRIPTTSTYKYQPFSLASTSAFRKIPTTTYRTSYHFYSTVLNGQTEGSPHVSPAPPKPNVKKVLVVGSGGLSIGQAGEFDYSGKCDFSLSLSLSLSLFLSLFLSIAFIAFIAFIT